MTVTSSISLISPLHQTSECQKSEDCEVTKIDSWEKLGLGMFRDALSFLFQTLTAALWNPINDLLGFDETLFFKSNGKKMKDSHSGSQ